MCYDLTSVSGFYRHDDCLLRPIPIRQTLDQQSGSLTADFLAGVVYVVGRLIKASKSGHRSEVVETKHGAIETTKTQRGR